MTAEWPAKAISDLLTTTLAPKMSSIKSTQAPVATIDVLITFDKDGVSSHPNHKSLHGGAHAFLKSLMQRHAGWDCPIKLYTLTSTNALRKYMGILDAPATVLALILRKKEMKAFPTPLLFVSGFSDFGKARSAMTEAHKSQMLWFRWGWISLSRYMVMNDLKKEYL